MMKRKKRKKKKKKEKINPLHNCPRRLPAVPSSRLCRQRPSCPLIQPLELSSRTVYKYWKQVHSQCYPSGSRWKDGYQGQKGRGWMPTRDPFPLFPSEGSQGVNPHGSYARWPGMPACGVEASIALSGVPMAIPTWKSHPEKTTSGDRTLPSSALCEAAI